MTKKKKSSRVFQLTIQLNGTMSITFDHRGSSEECPVLCPRENKAYKNRTVILPDPSELFDAAVNVIRKNHQ